MSDQILELHKRKVLGIGDVALLFGVDPKTVVRWAQAGKIPHFKTPGGHHRFYADEILPLLDTGETK